MSEIKNPELYRAQLSCKIGKDAIEGRIPAERLAGSAMEYAMYNLLSAIEDIAKALEKQQGE